MKTNSERDRTIEAAIRAGKFARSRAAHWRRRWDRDPDGTETVIASLATGDPSLLAESEPNPGDAVTSEELERLFGHKVVSP